MQGVRTFIHMKLFVVHGDVAVDVVLELLVQIGFCFVLFITYHGLYPACCAVNACFVAVQCAN